MVTCSIDQAQDTICAIGVVCLPNLTHFDQLTQIWVELLLWNVCCRL